MINNIVSLFTALLTSCLQFSDIVLFLSAVCLLSVVVTVVIFLIRGKY